MNRAARASRSTGRAPALVSAAVAPQVAGFAGFSRSASRKAVKRGNRKLRVPSNSGARRPRPAWIKVTDHALLRWLERFEGVDLDAARRRLLRHLQAGRVPKLLEFAGDAEFEIQAGGGTFRGRDGRLITCWRT